jgi:acid stress-induced BolA-like protein IbaG/YrbA
MLDPDLIQKRIAEAIPTAQVEVRDLTGTGDHFEAQVVSSTFLGKSMIQQHQEVYAAVQDLLKTGELHALALKTFTPEQWKTLRPPGL